MTFRRMSHYILLAAIVLNPGGHNLLFPQTNSSPGAAGAAVGSALGPAAFDAASALVLRRMKEPHASVGLGPRRLDFNRVNLSKSALNVVSITNGTNSAIEIETLLPPPSGFRLASSVTLPLTVPPQTQALLTIEFFPTRTGNYSGAFSVLYRTSDGGPPHKMGIELTGKGVRE